MGIFRASPPSSKANGLSIVLLPLTKTRPFFHLSYHQEAKGRGGEGSEEKEGSTDRTLAFRFIARSLLRVTYTHRAIDRRERERSEGLSHRK
jgi:hypothetical protein